MSDKDINQMDFKELRSEVQLLRDELAIMRREYEDLFYNLDTENFSSKLTKKINSVVTSDKVESMITQEADKIDMKVQNRITASENLIYLKISEVQITADGIKMIVSNEEDGTESIFKQSSNGFRLDGNQVIISNMRNSSDESGDYGDSYVKVLSTGLNLFVYDTTHKQYIEKIGIGFYSGFYDHPYVTFGAGTGEKNADYDKYTGKQIGCIYKLGNGLWIGDASACNVGKNYPGGTDSATTVEWYLDGNGAVQDGRNLTGIFIDLVYGAIYRYEKGICTRI